MAHLATLAVAVVPLLLLLPPLLLHLSLSLSLPPAASPTAAPSPSSACRVAVPVPLHLRAALRDAAIAARGVVHEEEGDDDRLVSLLVPLAQWDDLWSAVALKPPPPPLCMHPLAGALVAELGRMHGQLGEADAGGMRLAAEIEQSIEWRLRLEDQIAGQRVLVQLLDPAPPGHRLHMLLALAFVLGMLFAAALLLIPGWLYGVRLDFPLPRRVCAG